VGVRRLNFRQLPVRRTSFVTATVFSASACHFRATAYRLRFVEERFIYRKPPIGKTKAAVVLNGGVQVEHPMLKAPLLIPLDQVAGAVRVIEVDPAEREPVLRRDVRVLDLRSSAFTDSNVVFVFKAPVHVARFKFGAENALPISARERKRGLDMDALGVTVEEPDQLHGALVQRGVRLFPTVASAITEVVGEATGEGATHRRRELARARARARLVAVGFGTLWTTLLAARFAFGGDANDVPTSTAIGLIVSSLAWAALVASVVVSAGTSTGGRRPIRDRANGWHALGYLAVIGAIVAVPLVVAGWLASQLGTPRVLAYGLVAGVPGGVLCGIGLRTTRRPPG
jgi:hypothetical protein